MKTETSKSKICTKSTTLPFVKKAAFQGTPIILKKKKKESRLHLKLAFTLKKNYILNCI